MDDKLRLELIKAGLTFVGNTLTQIISNVNSKRLEEKRIRKLKGKYQSDKAEKVQLRDSERLFGQLVLNIDEISENIQKHITFIERWAQIIKFSDLDKKKTLGSVYIQLDTYLLPAKKHISIVERSRKISLEKAVLNGKDHCVILGQPGAGKTTSLKKICDLLIREKSKTQYTFPILIRLRDLGDFSSPSPIFDQILQAVPLEFDFEDSKNAKFEAGVDDVIEEAVFSFLNHVRPIIVLDGFDELKDSQAKDTVLKELRVLVQKLTDSKIVLSCRTGEFNYELDYSNTYEIAPLNDSQIELFVNKWLKDKDKADDFLFKVRHSPFADTSIKPLNLAHLCAIYNRIGNVPEQPKTIYRKVVNLLIEEWDEQRVIIRKTTFDGFQSDQKFEFLTHLAFYLTTVYKTSIFTVDQFKIAYQNICEYHNLPLEKASAVVKELEAHTGLFIESGYDKFEFVHKSVQEYLTAEYLVKLPSLNTIKKHFDNLGAELAIAIAISSNSSLYFIELILNYFIRVSLTNSFFNSFISRVISENPAFNKDELVNVTALVLLSRWIYPDNKKFNVFNNGFNIDIDAFSSFFDLISKLKLKEQKVDIFKYYKYVQDVNDNKLVELTRIKEPENHKRLPSKIYIPVEFYDEFAYNI